MDTRKFLVVIPCLALALLGCGGGGTSSGASGANPYIGSWKATYSVPGFSNVGTLAFTVDAQNNLSGTVNDSNHGNGAISGDLLSSGSTTDVITFADGSTDSLNGKVSLSGSTFTGTLSSVLGGQSSTVTITATKQ